MNKIKVKVSKSKVEKALRHLDQLDDLEIALFDVFYELGHDYLVYSSDFVPLTVELVKNLNKSKSPPIIVDYDDSEIVVFFKKKGMTEAKLVAQLKNYIKSLKKEISDDEKLAKSVLDYKCSRCNSPY